MFFKIKFFNTIVKFCYEQLVDIDDYFELRRCLMKTVLLHGLGQTAQDWKEVVQQLSISDVDCPELFSSAEDEISYSQIWAI